MNLDIYPLIARKLDWISLHSFKKVNYYCYQLYEKEKVKRLNSAYPFGEKNSKIKILVDDIFLKEIWCLIENVEIQIKLPMKKFYTQYVYEILDEWFHYDFNSGKWFLTGKIIRSVIKLNKVLTNGDFDTLIFEFKENKSFLQCIK